MDSSFLTTTLVPLSLFIIILGMGLGLTIKDFKQILVEPKAVILGLLAQLVMVPIVGFILAFIFPLSPELAVGVVLVAACPGGATSNLLTYLAKGNVALSVTLTAFSSLVTVFSIPLVVNLALQLFLDEAVDLRLPFVKTVIRLATIVILPLIIGMVIKSFRPSVASTIEKGVKWFSIAFITLLVVLLIAQEWDTLHRYLFSLGGVTLSLSMVTMALGFAISVLARLDVPSTRSITIEVGIQSTSLAWTVASLPSLLNRPVMAVPALVYGLLMFGTSAGFISLARRQPSITSQ
ncbi:bile acid:sodium symporter [filamentous cyanobacterium LEGE 11480]|uniref:Bile acid:sodium symporter n=1 Tax=Romeriopsis navalis LEGE 11480 TaxID=2777977 RepID=A0A928VQN8_9CYAN|nr:bile acid:sodium symporter family protein [Romeriopsis navalis]MBE9030344.1 bile acid:sodium symporter [Romeriopsis navalis LEGE 11480]